MVPKRTDLGRLLLRADDGSVRPYADCDALPGGLNEVVADGRGNVYVNGVGFDFLKFIAEPSDAPLTAFDIAADGDLSNRRVFAEEDPFGGERSGQVLTVPAPVAGVGWP